MNQTTPIDIAGPSIAASLAAQDPDLARRVEDYCIPLAQFGSATLGDILPEAVAELTAAMHDVEIQVPAYQEVRR